MQRFERVLDDQRCSRCCVALFLLDGGPMSRLLCWRPTPCGACAALTVRYGVKWSSSSRTCIDEAWISPLTMVGGCQCAPVPGYHLPPTLPATVASLVTVYRGRGAWGLCHSQLLVQARSGHQERTWGCSKGCLVFSWVVGDRVWHT